MESVHLSKQLLVVHDLLVEFCSQYVFFIGDFLQHYENGMIKTTPINIVVVFGLIHFIFP
jgi:hypothetical protein